jgi:hypothetical protein
MFDEPLKILRLMRNFKPDWFIAGGWAIDLYTGKETRRHEDIEIAIFRKDQIALQNYLDGWVLKKAVNGTLSEWKPGERLELPIHEIHCFKQLDEKPVFEVLLNESDGNEWMFRRNDKVRMPLPKLSLMSNLGMKFLRPEIVLLYKSKNPRPKDEQDFEIVRKHLDNESKEWLKNALSICYSEHRWLQNL